MTFRADDILAAVILSLVMLRRLEVLGLQAEQNPGVSAEDFQRWRSTTLAAYHLAAIACLGKIVVNQLWFLTFKDRQWPLSVGGLVIFLSWVGASVVAWRRATDARAERVRLGIGQRPVVK